MHFKEFKIPNIPYHDELNPALWDGQNLNPKVRYALLKIAKHFIEFINVKPLHLKDITISGSNASYGYSTGSDIDLHLVVQTPPPAIKELFTAKKNQYNTEHNIKIRGIDVELYVQPEGDPHHSVGIFSVLDNRWIAEPTHSKPTVDGKEVRAKARNYSAKINSALTTKDLTTVQSTWAEIKKIRQAGLESGGEYSVENLAFKLLRSKGKIRKLHRHLLQLQNDQLSLGENFADGKNPEDKGDSKRYGINTKGSVSSLRKTAKQGGRKGQLAHWLANMKAGRKK